MLAIFRKDFSSLFHSFTGWLFIAILWSFMSLYIGMYCFIGLDPDVSDVLSVSATLLMILLPILCMRSFAEERKSRTDQMILTAPVTVGEVVLGKFLALASVYSIVMAGLCVYPLILMCFGSVPLAKSYTGLLGMWLFGLAEIAVCIFVSSLTESVIIAAVLSVACLFISLVVPNLQAMISAEGNILTLLLGVLDIPSRFDVFLNGRLDLTAMVYLFSVMGLFLFLTTQVIQKRRYHVSRKSLSFGVYSAGLIGLVIAIVVAVNLAVNRLPSSLTRLDVTTSGLYSLTDETREYLGALEDDITIYVLANAQEMDDILDMTLENMAECSDHITITYIDPATDVAFLQEYDEVLDAYWNSLVIESSQRYTVVDYIDIYEYTIDYTTYTQSVSGYDAEGLIDSAIAYVLSEDLPNVYTLTGHGETALGGNFTEVLTKLNCEYEDLDLLASDMVPEDCELLIINAPTSDLSSDDRDKILAYLEEGGALVAVTSYESSKEEMENFYEVLSYFGVGVSDAMVLDADQGYYYRSESYLLPDVGFADETEDVLEGNGYIFVAYSQALFEEAMAGEEEDGVAYSFTELLTTSENAYLSVMDTSEEEENDPPYILGLKSVVTKDTEDGDEEDAEDAGDASTGYIFGSEIIFSDSADEMVSGSNALLFSGMVQTVIEQEGSTDQISVPAKSISSEYLTVPAFTALVLCVFTIVAIPLMLLASGFVTWLFRQRK